MDTLLISCDGDSSCQYATINNDFISISNLSLISGDYALINATIEYSETSNQTIDIFDVKCNGISSCRALEIDGTAASLLTVSCSSTSSLVVYTLYIYFFTKTCIIQFNL